MEPTGAWQEIINQGPLFAFMAIVIYFGARYFSKEQQKNQERYDELLKQMMVVQTEQIAAVASSLAANTTVLEQVRIKLDAADHD